MRNLYEVLGVPKNATDDDIKASYKKLALRWHPDRNPDDSTAEEKFKEISFAYETLKDSERRSKYDAETRLGTFDAPEFANLGDIFSSFFGGSFHAHRAYQKSRSVPPRQNVEISLSVPFIDAMKGTDTLVNFVRMVTCEKCRGRGAPKDVDLESCDTCRGAGTVRDRQGPFMFETTCPTCDGACKVFKHMCDMCGGRKRTSKDIALTVKIPPGVSSGNIMRVPDQGHEGTFGRGHLLIKLTVEKSDELSRVDFDIHGYISVPITCAILGGEVSVQTIYGAQTAVIPPKSNPDTLIFLPNKGTTNIRTGQRGDHIVHLNIDFPESLTPEQLEHVVCLKKLGL